MTTLHKQVSMPGVDQPPVILLGGESNVLSIARSLSKVGVKVYAINYPDVSSLRSRYLTRIAIRGDSREVENWRDYLLSSASDHLKGAVLFCCGDQAIMLLIENWDALSARFVLEACPRETRARLLDKQLTYESTSSCGVAQPKFWSLQAGDGIDKVARTCLYPVILKPRLQWHWVLIGAKYLRANSLQELKRVYQRCADLNIPVVAMEFIPGGDDLSCSYYTYIDETGIPLVQFTKRLLRRHPANKGDSSYHISDRNPEVAEKGLRLFQHVGLRGLGNVEFKRDQRDGEWKLIEINARFSGGNALVTRSGIDLALLSYSQLTGRHYEIPRSYELDRVMLDPIADFLAFRELNAIGELTLTQWLRQIMRADVTLNLDWRDPLPALHYLAMNARFGARLVMTRREAIPDQAPERRRPC